MRGWRLLGGLLGLVLVQGCAGEPDVQRVTFEELKPPAPGPIELAPHRMRNGDIVTVKFLQNPELNAEVPVRQDGQISLALIGEVPVAGMTVPELRAALSERYKRFVAQTGYGEVLKEGDELELLFVYNPELNHGTRVRPDGKISLPLVGDVRAAGVSLGELRQDLIRRYARVIKNPDIALLVGPHSVKKVFADEAYLTVSLSKLADQTVFVGGEVQRPQVVHFESQITTFQSIMQSGGFTDKADLSRVVILRRGHYEQKEWIQTNLDGPLGGERFQNDLVLHQGDVVIVPKSGIAKWDLWVQQYIRDALPVQTYMSIFFIPYQASPN